MAACNAHKIPSAAWSRCSYVAVVSAMFSFFHLLFEVWGREPAVAHQTESVASWPEGTGGRGKQPNLNVLSLPRKRGECCVPVTKAL